MIAKVVTVQDEIADHVRAIEILSEAGIGEVSIRALQHECDKRGVGNCNRSRHSSRLWWLCMGVRLGKYLARLWSVCDLA